MRSAQTTSAIVSLLTRHQRSEHRFHSQQQYLLALHAYAHLIDPRPPPPLQFPWVFLHSPLRAASAACCACINQLLLPLQKRL
jgi:hypothetical protein